LVWVLQRLARVAWRMMAMRVAAGSRFACRVLREMRRAPEMLRMQISRCSSVEKNAGETPALPMHYAASFFDAS